MTNIVIRKGEPADTKLILDFIRELAVYEKLEHMVVATVQDLEKHLFGDSPKAKVLLAEEDGKPLGFALYFYNFSTFLGRPGIYLEDLFVRPEARGVGVGKLLLQKLAQIAVEENCGRFEWWVLDWNEPAINFYKRVGARAMDEWTVYRVDGDNLKNLATE